MTSATTTAMHNTHITHMKIKVLTTAIVLLSSLAAAASAQPPAKIRHIQTIGITGEALAAGISDTLRLGKMHSGEVAVKSVALRNDTDKPFVIVRHENSCGCATFKYGRKPVQPGEYADIECTFDSRGTYGWQMKLAKFHLSGGKNPVRIFIDAEVE